ncbi:MAG: acyltransferase [Bacteroidaceae bacterium]|nr:acyltransferase [Bacteroidaceae bacterium]
MKIKGIEFKISTLTCLGLYYGFAKHLPASFHTFGKQSKWIRYQLVKHIFKKCGKNVNVEHGASFGSGRDIEIGDNSGIGRNCCIPSNTIIGDDVMMGPNCFIIRKNHSFDRIDIPMRKQGYQSKENVQTIIEDDVWIGMNVLMTPGRHISKGTIIGGGTLLCKDFPAYSVVGGNPSRLLKRRNTK